MIPQIKQRIEQIRRGEVPEGYKKTKAGTIPFEWDLHPLSKHLIESRIPGTNGAIAKKLTVKLWNKGVFEKREVHEGSESTTYYKRKSGQLIYSKLDFLNCAFGIIPEYLDGYESTQDLPCFDVKGVIPNYLLTYVTQRNFYMHFGMIADGGRKARRVGPEDMLSFPLVYPPLAEQEKIAEILHTQDKVIELKEKLIEEKKRQKKALMQQLLTGKKRLPGFSSEWKKQKMSDILCERKEKNKDQSLRICSVAVNSGVVDQREHLGKSMAASDTSNYNVVHYGDIVYTKSPTGAFPYGIMKQSQLTENVAVSPLYGVYEPTSYEIGYLLNEYFMYSNNANGYLLPIINKGAKNTINISNATFITPSLYLPTEFEEIKNLVQIFKVANTEIEILQKDLDQEKQKKKALMQLLLTGIVRIGV
mgnify:FL=1